MFRRSRATFLGSPGDVPGLLWMHFPYGQPTFKEIRKEQRFWRDNSDYILPVLNHCNPSGLFLRPPRFGKSLFMDMLHSFLDVHPDSANEFENLFGIGFECEATLVHKRGDALKHKSKYRVMKFDLSVDLSSEDPALLRTRFYDVLATSVQTYCDKYDLPKAVHDLAERNPFSALTKAVSVSDLQEVPTFILIDEYDRFANKLIFENGPAYQSIVAGVSGDKFSSPVRSLFETIKASTTARCFTTGLTPIALADASGANNILHFTDDLEFAAMLGLFEEDAKRGIDLVFDDDDDRALALTVMKKYVNGYAFPAPEASSDNTKLLYNPQFCIHFLQRCTKSPEFRRRVLNWQEGDPETCLVERLDPGSRLSDKVVKAVVGHPSVPLMLGAMSRDAPIAAELKSIFTMSELTSSTGLTHPVSFLVWHGLLTRRGDGYAPPNLLVGTPTANHGLMKELFSKTECNDVVNAVQNPTEEGIWQLFSRLLKSLMTPLDNSVSELAIQGMLEIFLRAAGLTVKTELTLSDGTRFDMLISLPDGLDALLVEFKRLRPPSAKNDGDIMPKDSTEAAEMMPMPPRTVHFHSAIMARAALEPLCIVEDKRRIHNNAATVKEVEEKAMEQCVRYKELYLKSSTTSARVSCATVLSVSTADTTTFPMSVTSTFLVKVRVDDPKASPAPPRQLASAPQGTHGNFKGTVKNFFSERGYGFIKRRGENDLFVRARSVVGNPLQCGDSVTFDKQVDDRREKFSAVNVRGGTGRRGRGGGGRNSGNRGACS